MQLAVDQHTAGATAALAAAEFRRHIADQFAQSDQQIGAAIDEDRDVAAVMTKLQGGLGHDELFLTREETAQMYAGDLAAIPGAAERVVEG